VQGFVTREKKLPECRCTHRPLLLWAAAAAAIVSHPSHSQPQYGRELIGLAPWLVGPTELPRCPAVINILVLPTFTRGRLITTKIGERVEFRETDGPRRALSRRVLIQRRRFVTAEFYRISRISRISLPLYCIHSSRHPSVPVTRRCIILFQKVPQYRASSGTSDVFRLGVIFMRDQKRNWNSFDIYNIFAFWIDWRISYSYAEHKNMHSELWHYLCEINIHRQYNRQLVR